jgi:Spy/CpxP family protein refolding chaperone
MSFTSRPKGKPPLSHRAIICIGIPVTLALGVVRSPFAQSAPGGYGHGGPGAGRWPSEGRMGPPRGGEHRLPSPEAIEGPPSPALMRDSLKLDQDQLQRYAQRYGNHMAATRGVRDSLRTTMASIRASFENGDRSAIREQRTTVERQWKELADQDKNFDKGLKDILSKDQQKRYQKWKDKREKAARDQWRRDRVPPAGGGEGWVNQVKVR